MANPATLAALIIAGGRSRRLGVDKRRLRLWGANGPLLLEHTLSTVQAVVPEVVLALNDPEVWPQFTQLTVADHWPAVGPLAGLAAGFVALEADWVLVVAADLPLLTSEVLTQLLQQPRLGDAIVPQHSDGRYEPLVALYRRTTLPMLVAYVDAGGRSVQGWLQQLQVQPWNTATITPDVWLNLNRPEDVELFRVKFS